MGLRRRERTTKETRMIIICEREERERSSYERHETSNSGRGKRMSSLYDGREKRD